MKFIAGANGKRVLLTLFLAAVAYWLVFVGISGYGPHPLGIYTQLPLVIIPVLGGLIGLRKFIISGHAESLGMGILGTSLAILLFGIAMGVWTFYLWQGVALPYPSLADYIFVWSPVLWIFGFFRLSREVGGPYGLRKISDFVIGTVASVVVVVIAYYLLVVVAHGNVLGAPEESRIQLFFDYAYTLGALALAVMSASVWGFSWRYLGGRYRDAMLCLSLGFLIHFLAVFFFVLTITNGTYFNGNVADILFTVALYLEALGIVNINTRVLDAG